jgi:hypothetical protein
MNSSKKQSSLLIISLWENPKNERIPPRANLLFFCFSFSFFITGNFIQFHKTKYTAVCICISVVERARRSNFSPRGIFFAVFQQKKSVFPSLSINTIKTREKYIFYEDCVENKTRKKSRKFSLPVFASAC